MHFFRPILNPNGDADPAVLTADLSRLATALGIPTKNVRQWWHNDSIPGGWHKRVAATGIASTEEILDAAEARDIAAATHRAKRSPARAAA